MSEETYSSEALEKCNVWLQQCSLDSSDLDNQSCCSEFSSISSSTDLTSSSELTNNSAMDSGFNFVSNGVSMSNVIMRKTENESPNNELSTLLCQRELPPNSKIQIYKSKKVHIGDVNYILGPVYVNGSPSNQSDEAVKPVKEKIVPTPLHIIERKCWLAQPPLEINRFRHPAKHVVICHSATEDASTIAENTLLVRLIQSFHVDSRRWSDIAYNFLIGNDGSVFEGRGWNNIGSHTLEYNSTSIGICFIGTYVRKKPTSNALLKGKQLINYGLSIGALDENFSLLGHCQCRGSESPGEALFQEIQTWPNFDPRVSLRNPSFALPSLKNADQINLP